MTAADPPTPDSPLRAHLRVTVALMLREVSTRHGRAAGGYLWAVAEPVGMIALMSVAFALMLRAPDLGDSFVAFFATGFVPFNFYRVIARKVATARQGLGALLRLPGVAPADALAARFVLQTLTGLVVAVAIVGGAALLTGEPLRPDPVPLAAAAGAGTLMGLGMGVANAVLFRLSGFYERVFGVVSRPLFLVSAVIYTPESLPPPVTEVLLWNPLVHVVGAFRAGLYPAYDSQSDAVAYPAAVGLVLLCFGLLLLRRHGGRLAAP